MSYLLDTNVLSEVRKPGGDPGVHAWFATVAPGALYLSALVVGEIRQGIERLRSRDPRQAATYDAWLDTLHLDFADRIVPITVPIAEEWGRLSARASLPPVDGLLAATAKVQGLILVTRNTAHIEPTGVATLNPFRAR